VKAVTFHTFLVGFGYRIDFCSLVWERIILASYSH